MVLISLGKVLWQMASRHFLVVQTTLIHLLGFPFTEVPTMLLNMMRYLKQLPWISPCICPERRMFTAIWKKKVWWIYVAKYRHPSFRFGRKMPSNNVLFCPSRNSYLPYYSYATRTIGSHLLQNGWNHFTELVASTTYAGTTQAVKAWVLPCF